MNRSFPTTLLALALVACGSEPATGAKGAGSPPPAGAHPLTLTYFTMKG